MNKELSKRIITSIFLLILLGLAFTYTYILIISLILISLITWIEFNGLLSKIFIKKIQKANLLNFSFKLISLAYLTFFSILVFQETIKTDNIINIIYIFSICICSDIGGLIFGKIFKGKKLTKISPNKTISGSVGSFALSLLLVPLFHFISESFNFISNYFNLTILALTVSFICQLGDLFISYLKRKANVKDTGDLLPGHGGILDRIDGILFAVPIGFIVFRIL
tara:strand:+ start:310 stop:981 length:672 start_codon:yes stop_codon:yes gene_type:complete